MDFRELDRKYGRDDFYRETARRMPWLSFPPAWEVQVIGPFAGAAARFCVRLKENPETEVSVYADFDESLGRWGGPYWEVYPVDGDTWRSDIDNTSELMATIGAALREGEKG